MPPGRRFATVRAGLIVGPHDNIFRLPWWVRRIAEGGTVPAPGHPDRQLQIIDARDLARFLLDLAEQRVAGAFNGTGPIGQTTWGELLGAAGDAELVWIPDEQLVAGRGRAVDGAPDVAARRRYRGNVAHRHRQGAGGRPHHPPGRRNRRSDSALAGTAAASSDRRLARRAPPAEDERGARGSTIPTRVLGIRVA